MSVAPLDGKSGRSARTPPTAITLILSKDSLSVGFTTAAALVHELIEARGDKRLLPLQRQLAAHKLPALPLKPSSRRWYSRLKMCR
jgi:hypothetical protein